MRFCSCNIINSIKPTFCCVLMGMALYSPVPVSPPRCTMGTGTLYNHPSRGVEIFFKSLHATESGIRSSLMSHLAHTSMQTLPFTFILKRLFFFQNCGDMSLMKSMRNMTWGWNGDEHPHQGFCLSQI